MRIKSFRKKAVSPLIATVLLIAFAVALGAVVMNWGKAQFVEPVVAEGVCGEISFKIEKIDGKPNVCYSTTKSNTVNIIATNDGSRGIMNFKITYMSKSGEPFNEVIDKSLLSSETKKIEAEYPAEFGVLSKLKITPVVFDETGSEVICTLFKSEFNSIHEC